ncbi:mannose-6-phosphate isomerase type 1 [Roseimicrobium gellanilyticum]|uniref:Mannose-6-phosphate isomerase type 1 n=1 Tax=Roseimicrobium gellanilyticum TaxID=748857 RepID=A0A366HWI1_9BACT|nr:type I phosphomannose isomerase catalytic subunit [Roseimicrobium gellanilyticum]RBP47934.1 mannose-6-phosphate isomerase type 1 [Roseimicrobium gellanilyticum]
MTPPLRFQPLYQTRVWGGRRLESVLGRELPDAQPYGESWELCDRVEHQSRVMGGVYEGLSLHDLWTQHRERVFGRRYVNHPAERFPMLLKVLDCEDVLSLQVHPPASIAARLGGEPKTEMWYVMDASPRATIYAGLRAGVTRDDFVRALDVGQVAELVHRVRPRKDQFMFVESGRLHALGAGLMVYEIQQNSDTTYRVFDWNRVGLDGKPRELHVPASLASIDFADVEPALQESGPEGTLASCPWFDVCTADALAGESVPLKTPEDFVCIAVMEGSVDLEGVVAGKGSLLLVPPVDSKDPLRAVTAVSDSRWLEIRLP